MFSWCWCRRSRCNWSMFTRCFSYFCAMARDVKGSQSLWPIQLTHWCRLTHICISKLTTIGSDNGLSPDRHQAIIWTSARFCQLNPWEQTSVKFHRILYIFIDENAFEIVVWKLAAILPRPQCDNPPGPEVVESIRWLLMQRFVSTASVLAASVGKLYPDKKIMSRGLRSNYSSMP